MSSLMYNLRLAFFLCGKTAVFVCCCGKTAEERVALMRKELPSRETRRSFIPGSRSARAGGAQESRGRRGPAGPVPAQRSGKAQKVSVCDVALIWVEGRPRGLCRDDESEEDDLDLFDSLDPKLEGEAPELKKGTEAFKAASQKYNALLDIFSSESFRNDINCVDVYSEAAAWTANALARFTALPGSTPPHLLATYQNFQRIFALVRGVLRKLRSTQPPPPLLEWFLEGVMALPISRHRSWRFCGQQVVQVLLLR